MKQYSMSVHSDNCTSAGQGVSSGDKLGHVDNPATDDFVRNSKPKLRACVSGILKPRVSRNF
jgi:hypothetical protein